jgi:hypothetical protein
VALELAKKINQLSTELETNPIQMQWKEENLHGENLPAQNGVEKLTLLKNCKKPEKLKKCQGEKTEVNNKKYLRARKTPVMKSNDFLW